MLFRSAYENGQKCPKTRVLMMLLESGTGGHKASKSSHARPPSTRRPTSTPTPPPSSTSPLPPLHHPLPEQTLFGRQRQIGWVLFSALCWALWTTRNKLTIDAVVPKHPSDVIYKMCMFIQVWANLAKVQDKEALLLMSSGLKEIYHAITPGSSQA